MVAAMNRALALLLAAFALLLPAATPAQAQAQFPATPGARVVSSVSWVEEWDPASGQWVRVEDSAPAIASAGYQASTTAVRAGSHIITETVTFEQPVRFIPAAARMPATGAGIARFGPFRVIDGRRAALVASTDAASPQAFSAMMAAYPGLEVIEFADAPGTSHDLANLRLGRAIRAAGLATHVPAGGSARSGAVELFLAGTRRTVEPGALFAVHSWRDEAGREPADFAPDAPENRLYLDYYAEMGMAPDQARAFYAMTNSVPHAGALWLEGAEMAHWIAPAAQGGGERVPASRSAPFPYDAALRAALARSGAALVDALRTGWTGPSADPVAPKLAYADLTVGLLDSGAAFP